MNNDQRDDMIREIHSHVLLHTEQIKDIRKVMFGNGRPGICDRLNQVETLQSECREGQRNRSASLPAWVQNLISLGSLLIAAAAVYVAMKS